MSAAASHFLLAAAAAHAVSILVGGFDRHRFVENSLIGAYVACGGGSCTQAWCDEACHLGSGDRREVWFWEEHICWVGVGGYVFKCGLIDEAHKVFDGMQEKNVYTYSSMIAGLASHGRASEVIALFKEMVSRENVEPNHVTFIGVLTACSHAGLVGEGRYYFAQMKDKYGVLPSADHYACMVDLLDRSGLVDEALDLVRSMTMKPHGGVWGELLGACRFHGKSEIAKVAAEHLFKLVPEGIENYVLLSNILTSAGKWDGVKG
ncbi:hypothetical protein ABZP36_012229 [Zizania latifolia]